MCAHACIEGDLLTPVVSRNIFDAWRISILMRLTQESDKDPLLTTS